MASEFVKELIDAGIHFGHRVSRWNPKMKPYIYGKRNLIHIIDAKETIKGILLAKKFVTQTVAAGKDIMLIGTKRQARKAVEDAATETGMHYVNDRWLGGTLTNFREIRKRIQRLDELEQMDANGLLDQYSKKQGASLRREMRKIRRNLGGIRNMEKLPGAMFVVDQKREMIAVREARKMSVPVIGLIDTDSDPDVIDIPIPGNDDAMRAIELVVRQITEAVREGLGVRTEIAEGGEQKPSVKRRSRRAPTARAEANEAAAEAAPEAAPDQPQAPAAEVPAPAPAEPEAQPSPNPENA